jgi:hypothetical protein
MNPRRTALAILVLIGVLAIIEAILGDIVASLLQNQLGDHAWLIVVPFIMIAAVLLGFGLRDQVHALLQDRRPAFDRHNRQAMLDKLRAIYAYRFQRSLVHEVLIALDLVERAAAVVCPLDLLVQRPDHADLRLPQGTRVVEMFDELDRALLILGEPGAGKTTLLLELALDLLGRAAQDAAHRIPVVFQLSSWAQQRRPLADWLVDALHEQYEIPPRSGKPGSRRTRSCRCLMGSMKWHQSTAPPVPRRLIPSDMACYPWRYVAGRQTMKRSARHCGSVRCWWYNPSHARR